MKIAVKKTHIHRGEQRNARACPIALALKESLGLDDVRVNCHNVEIGKTKIDLPQIAEDFIVKFDRDKKAVQPFVLEI